MRLTGLGRVAGTLAIALVVASPGAWAVGPRAPRLPLEPDGRWLRDQAGRVVIVHGLQVAHKKPPYHPPPASFTDRDARSIARWGFNGIRLAWFWKGLEPRRGDYDRRYAREIARENRLLARRGVMVQLEAHQDHFSEVVHGAGFPDWATLTDGIPVQPDAGGTANALGPAEQRAFDNLYANRDGIADAFARAWAVMARAVRRHRPGLGYDLYNEPYGGTQTATCFNPEGCPVFDRVSLGPLLDRLARGVRRVDARTVVWYEPMFFFGGGAATSLAPPPRDVRPAGFAFHLYCLAALATGQPDRESEAPGYPACPTLDERVFDNAAAAGRAMGDIPALFNEFGDTQDLAHIRRVIELAERRMTGWMYWGYKDWVDVPGGLGSGALFDDSDDNSTLRVAKLKTLSRPYPMLTAGVPEEYGFDAGAREFTFSYAPDRRIKAPTVVFTAPLQFPQGYRARVSGARVVSRRGARRLVLENRPRAKRVTVRIVPR